MILVSWLLFTIIRTYSKNPIAYKYIKHGQTIEIIWTIFPAVVLLIIAFVVIGNSITIIKDIPLSEFEPFQNNKKLVDISYSNKIEDNPPKMEGASAFYPLAANIVQAVYSKEAYTKDVLKMATINGFKILGKDISIQEGNISDILLIKQIFINLTINIIRYFN